MRLPFDGDSVDTHQLVRGSQPAVLFRRSQRDYGSDVDLSAEQSQGGWTAERGFSTTWIHQNSPWAGSRWNQTDQGLGEDIFKDSALEKVFLKIIPQFQQKCHQRVHFAHMVDATWGLRASSKYINSFWGFLILISMDSGIIAIS